MTDQQRDPEAAGPVGAADPGTPIDDEPTGAPDVDDEAETEDLTAADDDSETDDETDDEAATPAAAAGTAAVGPADRRRLRGTPPKGPAAPPSIAQEAVHVQDRASAIFVIVVVGVFVAIILYGLVLGQNGFLTDALATPKPVATVTAEPSSTAPSAAPSASVSAAPSAAASPAASASPSASASASPSAAASASAPASPSAAPASPSPSAS